eukprot:gene8381-9067_t
MRRRFEPQETTSDAFHPTSNDSTDTTQRYDSKPDPEVIDLTLVDDNDITNTSTNTPTPLPTTKKAKASHHHTAVSDEHKSSIWKPFYLNSVQGISPEFNQGAISFSDFFASDEEQNPLMSIVLMNYMMDIEWMIGQVPALLAKPVLCLHGSTVHKEVGASHWTIAKVDLGAERFGTHHSKMMLLFFAQGIRVVVSTGNFIPEDFHFLTQGNFVQDFPLKTSASVNACDFESSLIEYLQHLSTSTSAANARLKEVIQQVRDYDFTAAEVILIPSVPGRHTGHQRQRWGIGKLHACLTREGCLDSIPSTSAKEEERSVARRLVMQYSSLGSMGKDGKYIDELAMQMLIKSLSSSSSSSFFSAQKELARLKKSVELVWPTVQTVRESLLGYESGNSLPSSFKNLYEVKGDKTTAQQQQPRLIEGFQGRLKRWDGDVSGRRFSTPHMKCYFRYHLLPDSSSHYSGDHQKVGIEWFVLTSANLSQAAWGVQQASNSQLYIKSYEMGVLYLPTHIHTTERNFSCTPSHPLLGMNRDRDNVRDRDRASRADAASASVFLASHSSSSHVSDTTTVIYFPIPFTVPPSSYQTDVDYPWVWDLPYRTPDRHNRQKV